MRSNITDSIYNIPRKNYGRNERGNEGGVKIQGRRINNLFFADDIDLIEEN